MSSRKTNPDARARHGAYLELVGLTPRAFEVLVAVMSHETALGTSALSTDVIELLGGSDDLFLAELTKGLWLTAEGRSNGPKLLTARDRAWRSLGVQRPGKSQVA